jgi:hypothetical protein
MVTLECRVTLVKHPTRNDPIFFSFWSVHPPFFRLGCQNRVLLSITMLSFCVRAIIVLGCAVLEHVKCQSQSDTHLKLIGRGFFSNADGNKKKVRCFHFKVHMHQDPVPHFTHNRPLSFYLSFWFPVTVGGDSRENPDVFLKPRH